MISLKEPMTKRTIEKPSPLKSPSVRDSRTGCLLANDSALPMMMQFVTMSGMNIPSAL